MRFIAPYHIHLSAFDSHGWKLYEVNEMANDYVKLSGFSYLQIAPSDIFSLKINKLLLWSTNDIAPLEQRLQQQFGQYLACYRTFAQQLEIGPRASPKPAPSRRYSRRKESTFSARQSHSAMGTMIQRCYARRALELSWTMLPAN